MLGTTASADRTDETPLDEPPLDVPPDDPPETVVELWDVSLFVVHKLDELEPVVLERVVMSV
jgi:hypothetical protein